MHKSIRILFLSLFLLLILGSASAAPPPEIPLLTTDENTLLFSFGGDCTLGSEEKYQTSPGHFVQVVNEKGPDYSWPFSGTKAIFEVDDLTLVNLEGTFTTYRQRSEKKFTFQAPPEFAEILPLGSVEAVNLANNHSQDFGQRGYEDTIAALSRFGIPFSDTEKPAVVEIKGVKIGLIGVTYPRQNKIDRALKDVARLREEGVQIIICSIHWGIEYKTQHNHTQTDFGHALIDGGVDIVVGTHPHILQGVELYNGKPIFYSMGNFSFGGNRNPREWDTMITQVAFSLEGDTPQIEVVRIIPCFISDVPQGNSYQDFRPVPVVGEDAARILTRISKDSVGFPDSFFESGYYYPKEGIAP